MREVDQQLQKLRPNMRNGGLPLAEAPQDADDAEFVPPAGLAGSLVFLLMIPGIIFAGLFLEYSRFLSLAIMAAWGGLATGVIYRVLVGPDWWGFSRLIWMLFVTQCLPLFVAGAIFEGGGGLGFVGAVIVLLVLPVLPFSFVLLSLFALAGDRGVARFIQPKDTRRRLSSMEQGNQHVA